MSHVGRAFHLRQGKTIESCDFQIKAEKGVANLLIDYLLLRIAQVCYIRIDSCRSFVITLHKSYRSWATSLSGFISESSPLVERQAHVTRRLCMVRPTLLVSYFPVGRHFMVKPQSKIRPEFINDYDPTLRLSLDSYHAEVLPRGLGGELGVGIPDFIVVKASAAKDDVDRRPVCL